MLNLRPRSEVQEWFNKANYSRDIVSSFDEAAKNCSMILIDFLRINQNIKFTEEQLQTLELLKEMI